MGTLFYLAYGSNLHPLRLMQRAPSAQLIGTTVLDDHTVVFSKKSLDGSSKCNLVPAPSSGEVVHAAVYEIPVTEKTDLDRVEGLGKGYNETQYQVLVGEQEYSVLTYIAASTYIVDTMLPYEWYQSMVVEGARYHRFPDQCIRKIISHPVKNDTNTLRRTEAENLLLQLKTYDGQ